MGTGVKPVMCRTVVVILLFFYFVSTLTARSFYNLSLGFGATYCPPERRIFLPEWEIPKLDSQWRA